MSEVSYKQWKKEMEDMLDDQVVMLVKIVEDIEEHPEKIGLLSEPLIEKVKKLKENYALYEMGKKLKDHLIYKVVDGQPSYQTKRREKSRQLERKQGEKEQELIEYEYNDES